MCVLKLRLFHISIEEWDRDFENWKERLQEAVEKTTNPNQKNNSGPNSDQKNLFKKSIAMIEKFKQEKAYQKCPRKPSDPNFTIDSDYNDVRKLIDAWKCAVVSQVPREEWPLCYVRNRDIAEVNSSQLFETYHKARAKGLIEGKIEIKRDCNT